MVRLALAEPVEREGADDGLLDGVVGQDALDQPGEAVGRPLDPVGPDRPDVLGGEPEVAEDGQALWPSGSVTPGLGRTWTTVPGPSGAWPDGPDGEGLDDRVDQDGLGRAADVGGGEVALDQEPAAGGDRPGAGQAELGGVGGDPAAFEVGAARGGVDLEVPEHGQPGLVGSVHRSIAVERDRRRLGPGRGRARSGSGRVAPDQSPGASGSLGSTARYPE